MYGGQKNCVQDYGGRPDGRRPTGVPRARLEDNIKMNPQEVERRAWTGFIWLRIGTGGWLL